MLTNIRPHIHRLCIAVAIIATLTLTTTSQALASTTWGDGGGDTGSIGITNPGTEGGGGSGNDVENITDVEFTPGPTTCTLNKGTHIHGDIHSKTNDKTVTKTGENCLK